MFPAEHIAAIFGNVEDIYEFSRTLLADLQKHILTEEPELSQIGSCFLRHVSSTQDIGCMCNNKLSSSFVIVIAGRFTHLYFAMLPQ